MSLQTRYAFTLPRGYVDRHGDVHREGVMRLATARDELEPLRDPTVDGPDDPRLTVVILARVVERLGALEMVTSHEIENLFAADLAFLQDFYGVINFGSQAEYEALVAAQAEAPAPVTAPSGAVTAAVAVPEAVEDETEDEAPAPVPALASARTRASIEEIRDGA